MAIFLCFVGGTSFELDFMRAFCYQLGRKLIINLLNLFIMCVNEFEKIITSNRLSKEQALAAVEEVFAKKTAEAQKANFRRYLFVDKDLKCSCFDDAVAVAALLHRKDPIAESIFLDDDFFDRFHFNKPFINIAFLEPIAHDAGLRESIFLIQEWAKTHYPQYHATLISSAFTSMSDDFGFEAFHDCWWRELENDGYPQYRDHVTFDAFPQGSTPDKLHNVYASLEEFEKLNPEKSRLMAF